uniref:Purine nucleoside phosphorylase n=1 Tax=Panagrellus redivivus TaxID=6233 RepID=A0A7E4VDH6_PANRE
MGNIALTGNSKKVEFNPRNYDDLIKLTESVRKQVDLKEVPTIGIICGSGLGGIGGHIKDAQTLPFKQIVGFPTTSVIGHKGNLVFGYLGGKYVVCLQGRCHPYEHGMDLALCAMPVRLMHQLGVETLIVSNAAGSANPKFNYGELMIIKDHIFMPGLAGFSPLVGVNDPRFGARFVSLNDAYDRQLRQLAQTVAKDLNIVLHEGVYVMSGGPQYETPAEVVFYKTVGVDALGMSTCHEVTVARQCGIKVLGFSLICNICNTDAEKSVDVSHEEVLKAAKFSGDNACSFVIEFISRL